MLFYGPTYEFSIDVTYLLLASYGEDSVKNVTVTLNLHLMARVWYFCTLTWSNKSRVSFCFNEERLQLNSSSTLLWPNLLAYGFLIVIFFAKYLVRTFLQGSTVWTFASTFQDLSAMWFCLHSSVFSSLKWTSATQLQLPLEMKGLTMTILGLESWLSCYPSLLLQPLPTDLSWSCFTNEKAYTQHLITSCLASRLLTS